MENPDWPASKVVPMLNVTSGIFSLALKHILIWEAVADLDLDAALVLEDDVIFLANDTVRVLDSWLGQMRPEDAAGPWSVWAGAGPQMLSTRGAVGYSANLMKHNLRRAHYGDTYLINAAAARCLLGAVPPFSLPIDWEITYGLRNVTTFWTKPRVTRQGSAKEYSSVLRDKKGEI
ncbi:hypothetical protein DFJ74DRAFT_648179 [Hyaloraphidium curvatum]|nr:hypothetical protein DFJ74DRAFT_648179 [Hyaloraphidium curvatum]